jgi:hypothetical protein
MKSSRSTVYNLGFALLTWLALVLLAVIGARAADSVVWDTANNTVTYYTDVDPVELGPEFMKSTTVGLAQFNAEVAATQGGGTASQYTLAKVVLGLDSTVYGSITFQNNGTATVTPTYYYSGYSRLVYGDLTTAQETYDHPLALGTVASGERVSKTLDNLGSGAVSSADITSDLAGFIGAGTATTTLYFPVSGTFYSGGVDFTTTVAVQGRATASVTYYYNYEPIPEPSTLALLAMGCVVVMLRRRRAI